MAETKKSSGGGFTAEERAAMKDADRAMATRIHEIVKAVAPHLTARLWYGSPA